MNTKPIYLLVGIATGLALAYGVNQIVLVDNPPDKPKDTFIVNDAKIVLEPEQNSAMNSYAADLCFKNVPLEFKPYSNFTAHVKTYYCGEQPFKIVVNAHATELIERPWGEVEQHNKFIFSCKLSDYDNFQAPQFETPESAIESNPYHLMYNQESRFSLDCQFKIKRERLKSSK